MKQSPVVFTRKRVLEALPQKTHAVRIFQLLNRRRIHSELFIEQLERALVLLASVDQHLFFLPLCLEYRDRHFAIEHDGDESRKHENDKQSRATLRMAFSFRTHCWSTPTAIPA